MRLLGFDLLRFGPFTDAALDFSAEGKGLHVIYGSNEAGKSTTLRAIAGLLYGIPENTRDAHRHKMPDLRVSATIETASGERIKLVRRKGRVNTLTDGEGDPVDEARLRDALGGVSREMFESMFGINHETLRSGGEDLLKVEGKIGESLFGAGLGAGVYEVQRTLEGAASALFAPQGKNHPLNQALRMFAEAKKRTLELSLPASEWANRARELEATREARDACTNELRARLADRARLRRLLTALPLLTRLDDVTRRRQALGVLVRVPDGCSDDRREAQRVLREAAPREEQLREQISRSSEQEGALPLPLGLLDEERAVEAIRDRLGAYRRALDDAPRLRAERARAEDRARAARRALGHPPDLDEADAYAPSAAEQARLRALEAERARLDAMLENASRQLGTRRTRLETEGRRLGDLPPPRDAEGLRRAIERARKAGDLDARLRHTQHEMASLQAEAQRKLNALGLVSCGLDELVALPLPSTETLDRFEGDWARATAERERIGRALGELEIASSTLDARIVELDRGMAVPTEAELAKARASRDTAWRTVRRELLGGAPASSAVRRDLLGDAPASSAQPTPEEAADGFERAMVAADEVGDRLRREADRVATIAALYAQRDEYAARRASLVRDRDRLRARGEALTAAWRSAWEGCGLEPLSPTEMRGWAARHERLLDASARLDALEATHRDLLELASEHRRTLAIALGTLDARGPEDPRALGPLIDYAESELAIVDAAARTRRELDEMTRGLAAEVRELEHEQGRARDALDAWRLAWAEAVRPLGARPNASPEEVTAALAAMLDLVVALADAREAGRKVDASAAEEARFVADVTSLCTRAATDLAALPPGEAADRVLKRLQQGREDRVKHDELAKQRVVAEAELAELERARAAAARRLDELVRAAGCTDEAELEEAERRSAQALALDAAIEETTARLAEIAEGAPLEALAAEASGESADGLRAAARSLDDELEQLERRKSELEERVGGLVEKLAAMDGRGAAADSALEAQAWLARVRDLTEQYVRHQLAALVLKNEIERYRERNQDPVLKRASELFASLTLGAFQTLRTAFDERDNAVLVCVRGDGAEASVAALSDGTRDQLYLALRLATLERHRETSPPMPLIVDDILIHVDDARAAATLRALGDLAARGQVLFFTHHARLVDLAREAVPDHRLAVHSLDAIGPQPTRKLAEPRLGRLALPPSQRASLTAHSPQRERLFALLVTRKALALQALRHKRSARTARASPTLSRVASKRETAPAADRMLHARGR